MDWELSLLRITQTRNFAYFSHPLRNTPHFFWGGGDTPQTGQRPLATALGAAAATPLPKLITRPFLFARQGTPRHQGSER